MPPQPGCQQQPTQCSTHHLNQPSPWAHRLTTRPWLEEQPRPTPPASLLTTRPTWMPRSGPLSIPWPLWLPLGYVVCVREWCAGAVPYAPCVLCVSCLYMWLPLMLTRWGTILARVGWDQTLFSSSPEIMLPKISSQTQRMGWWGAPCEVALRRWGPLQGTSGVLLQLTLG
uniref:HSPC217 n=1 Tax=Homo sapiens TaxID=9606 RepID=Q9P0Q9_HUMAN|nr:HSPC217 [Homo sapiens]